MRHAVHRSLQIDHLLSENTPIHHAVHRSLQIDHLLSENTPIHHAVHRSLRIDHLLSEYTPIHHAVHRSLQIDHLLSEYTPIHHAVHRSLRLALREHSHVSRSAQIAAACSLRTLLYVWIDHLHPRTLLYVTQCTDRCRLLSEYTPVHHAVHRSLQIDHLLSEYTPMHHAVHRSLQIAL
jgi:hypothetical protein